MVMDGSFGGASLVVSVLRGTPLNRWIRVERVEFLVWLLCDDSYGKSIPRVSEARRSLLLLEADLLFGFDVCASF